MPALGNFKVPLPTNKSDLLWAAHTYLSHTSNTQLIPVHAAGSPGPSAEELWPLNMTKRSPQVAETHLGGASEHQIHGAFCEQLQMAQLPLRITGFISV